MPFASALFWLGKWPQSSRPRTSRAGGRLELLAIEPRVEAALAHQIESLIDRAPEAVERAAAWIEGLQAGLLGIDLPLVDEQELAARLRSISPATVTEFLEQKRAEIGQRSWEAVLGLGRGIGSARLRLQTTRVRRIAMGG